MPYLLVTAFGLLVTFRIGYVMVNYYSDNMVAQAQEPKSKEKQSKETTNKTPSSEPQGDTIQDRLVEKNIQNNKDNSFSRRTARKPDIKTPKEVCITGIMLKDAVQKIEFLNKREAQILEQERLLEISNRRVREQVAKLKLIREEIIESAQLADSTIAKENKRLITIYEKMKPKDAANIFNEMQPHVAAELLRTMKEDQSSQILAKMNPKNAHAVTLSLAGNIKKTEEQYDNLRKEAN